MGYSKLIFTQTGEDLLAQAVVDNKLVLTKVELGEGTWNSDDEIKHATHLKKPQLTISPGPLQREDNKLFFTFSLTNNNLDNPFYLREIGFYGRLENQKEDKLIAMSYGTDKVDFIPTSKEAHLELTFKFLVELTNIDVVTVTLGDLGDYVTKTDLSTHNQDIYAHPSIRKKIEQVHTEIGEKITQHNEQISAHPKLRLFAFFMGE